MSLSDHRYVARLAPCTTTVADAVHDGARCLERDGHWWTESIASGGLVWPLKAVPVLLDHEPSQRVGFVTDVRERDGWHECEFVIDRDRPLADEVIGFLRVGTGVSIGAQSHEKDDAVADLGLRVKRHTSVELEEVSILVPPRASAYKGAKVTEILERGTQRDRDRWERERAERKAAAAPTSVAAAGPAVLHRNPVSARAAAEDEELRRRIDFYADNGIPIDVEQVIVNLQEELLGHPSLDRLYARHRRAA